MNNETITPAPTTGAFTHIFPTADTIPENVSPGLPIHQKEYLINGVMRTWDGPLAKVVSPIYLRTEQGLEQVELGSHPLLSREVALEAVDAAYAAFGQGRGLWPNLSVKKRVESMHKFVLGMEKKRKQ